MRVAAFSDTHFMDGGPRDDARPFADAFYRRLRELPEGIVPVGLGDICDVQRMGGNLGAIVQRYDPIFRELGRRRAIYVVGNHDLDILTKGMTGLFPGGISFCQRLVMDDRYWCHGHEFDLACGRWHWIGELGVKIANLLGKISPRLEDLVANGSGAVRGTGRHSGKRFCDYAVEFVGTMAHEQAVYEHGLTVPGGAPWHRTVHVARAMKGIVCGHSHGKAVNAGGLYVNTGSLTKGDGFTILDNGDYTGEVEL